MKPNFEHDCDRCKFIGSVMIERHFGKPTLCDVYVSCEGTFESSPIILRHGKLGEYITVGWEQISKYFTNDERRSCSYCKDREAHHNYLLADYRRLLKEVKRLKILIKEGGVCRI